MGRMRSFILLFLAVYLQHNIFGMSDEAYDSQSDSTIQQLHAINYQYELGKQKHLVDSNLTNQILNVCPEPMHRIAYQMKSISTTSPRLVPYAVLLTGNPGVGKSTLAQGLAAAADMVFIKIDCPTLGNRYQYSASNALRDAVRPAFTDHDNPYVIILDEIGSIMHNGTDQKNIGRDAAFAFLSIFNNLAKECPHSMIIATANGFTDFAPQVLSRFEKVVEVPLPTKSMRADITRYHLRTLQLYDDQYQITLIAKQTSDCSGREIEGLIKAIAGIAHYRKRNNASVQNAGSQSMRITDADIKQALNEMYNDPNYKNLHPSWFVRTKKFVFEHYSSIVATLQLGLTVYSIYANAQQQKQHQINADNQLELSKKSLVVAQEGLQTSRESAIMQILARRNEEFKWETKMWFIQHYSQPMIDVWEQMKKNQVRYGRSIYHHDLWGAKY